MVGISSAQSFAYVLEAERTKVDAVRGYLDALFAQHGPRHALTAELKKGVIVAALHDAGGGPRWLRAKIEGRHKPEPTEAAPPAAEAGLVRWDVLHVDVGSRAVATVMGMRPLEPPFSTYAPLAHEASLALLRVPPLEKEYGDDAAEMLSALTWGKPLLATVHGSDAATRSDLVELVDAESNTNVGLELVHAGFARVSSLEAKRVRRRAGGAEEAYLRQLEETQASAKKDRVGMWCYGDIGDSDTDEKPRRSGGAWAAAAGKRS